jgi:Fe/S biogenesis protein NfuA
MSRVVVPLELSSRAYKHFLSLIEQEQSPGMAIRILVENAGTKNAEVVISFCPKGQERQSDLLIKQEDFNIFVEMESMALLEKATIDYEDGQLEGNLLITAPNLHSVRPKASAPLEERLQFILDTEINPGLAQHKGMVSLVEITPEKVVILKFGGGCHGCGMVDTTLKQGIERNLKEQLPEITGVQDSTDHSNGKNPYFVKEGISEHEAS